MTRFKFAGFSGPHPSLIVDCPICASPVDHYCNDENGDPVDGPHDERRQLARGPRPGRTRRAMSDSGKPSEVIGRTGTSGHVVRLHHEASGADIDLSSDVVVAQLLSERDRLEGIVRALADASPKHKGKSAYHDGWFCSCCGQAWSDDPGNHWFTCPWRLAVEYVQANPNHERK